MDDEEVKKRIEKEDDFCNLKRFNFSIREVLERYPEGAPDRLIAAGLCMSEQEVEALYQSAVQKLKAVLKVTEDLDTDSEDPIF